MRFRRRLLPDIPPLPDAVWAPIATGALMLAVGMLGAAARQPWLFPSLGPTAFLQAEHPHARSSHPYCVVAGHGIGLAAGFFAVWALRVAGDPSVLVTDDLTVGRVAAAALAVALTMLLRIIFWAPHPPAAATTLLVALGVLRKRSDVLAVLGGVLIVAALGEGIRRLRLARTSVVGSDTHADARARREVTP
ncbi:MAG TPA: HPP family protein [Dehalococcoidia bacterium]|nr:HPP family protein [Dehalococcoidia bacterium]